MGWISTFDMDDSLKDPHVVIDQFCLLDVHVTGPCTESSEFDSSVSGSVVN